MEAGKFWERRTSLEQKLIISTGILGLLSVGLLIGIIVASSKSCDGKFKDQVNEMKLSLFEQKQARFWFNLISSDLGYFSIFMYNGQEHNNRCYYSFFYYC